MRKKLLFLCLALSLLALGGCNFFMDDVEYSVSGSSGSISVMYMDEGGNLVEVDASSPWSTSFSLMNSERPFMTYLKVTNNDSGSGALTLSTLVNGSQYSTATITAGTLTSVQVYYVVE